MHPTVKKIMIRNYKKKTAKKENSLHLSAVYGIEGFESTNMAANARRDSAYIAQGYAKKNSWEKKLKFEMQKKAIKSN